CIAECKNGLRVLVISVCGQVFMDPVDSPFTAAEKLLSSQKGNYDLAVCDFHAEATSEKAAFAKYFDGRIKIIFGTHTHVQTADERLTEKGGAFISDIGMVGVEDSVIGLTYDCAVPRLPKTCAIKAYRPSAKPPSAARSSLTTKPAASLPT
ncbi:MAG: YmdB family metallophosphoesterase, partial [Clostridiales bacterium]|nr:YmdB family metallophosphoesterase [Candidatus Coliplasma equi]